MAGTAQIRYAVGVVDVDGRELRVEYETHSRIMAFLLEQRIGWRELWRLLRGRGHRLTFTARLS